MKAVLNVPLLSDGELVAVILLIIFLELAFCSYVIWSDVFRKKNR